MCLRPQQRVHLNEKTSRGDRHRDQFTRNVSLRAGPHVRVTDAEALPSAKLLKGVPVRKVFIGEAEAVHAHRGQDAQIA